ncbi:MAG TPA: DUF222 domain-containing protein [Methylomirabilota bacterium]
MLTDSPNAQAAAGPLSELDRLGDEIAELSAHLDAATARLLDLIREFDARGGWNNGFPSCAAWLTWRVGLDLGAAREKVRVARALGTLPRLARALAKGELSYAKAWAPYCTSWLAWGGKSLLALLRRGRIRPWWLVEPVRSCV